MTKSPDLGVPLLAQAQANPDITHNEALLLFQALSNGVINMTTSVPPGSPTEGDSYVIAAAPTGAWASRANHITIYWGGAWRFVPDRTTAGVIIPIGARHEGLRVYDRATNQLYVWTGAAWTSLTGAVTSVFTRTGAVVAVAGDYDANQVDYNNATSGLAATEVQAAIDEIVASLGTAAEEDYFEGTWTPAFTFVTPGNVSVSYSQQIGTYVRIGKKVFATVRMFCTPTHTTASGGGKITGLPFAGMSSPASANYSQVFIGGAALSYPANRYVSGVLVLDGTAEATFNVGGPGGPLDSLSNTNIASGAEVRVQGVIIYEVA